MSKLPNIKGLPARAYTMKALFPQRFGAKATVGPGPAAYARPSEFGTREGPALRGRKVDRPAAVNAPYYSVPTTIGKAPAASIRSRHRVKESDSSPGPKYMVDSDIGKNQANAPSIRSRHPDRRETVGPGPGAFYPSKPSNAPAYSFTSKRYAEIADAVFRGEIPLE